MGRVTTPTYRAELFVREPSGAIGKQVLSWKGRATAAALEKFIFDYCDSLKIGGVNEHVSKALGYIPFPHKARIVRQRTHTVAAEWKAAMFQVF